MPANLKIDMDFVRDIAHDKTDQEVVKSIVGIVRSLDKCTIAEGVEDPETLALLRCYGVDKAQGFHLGAPFRLSEETEFERSSGNRPARVYERPRPDRTESGPRPHVEPARSGAPRILVAEDNEVNQLAALRLLERCGYDADLVSAQPG